MALIGSLTSGVSAMQSFVKGMEVISNNIANSKTTAFKRQRVGYSDSFSNTLRGASAGTEGRSSRPSLQVGGGVNLSATSKLFQQGAVEATGVSSDLAIVGEGFFRVMDTQNSNQYLTRNGSFRMDSDGYLSDQTGKRLIGLTGGTSTSEPDTLGLLRIDLAQTVKTNADGSPVDGVGRVVLDDGTRLQLGDDGTTYRVNAESELLDSGVGAQTDSVVLQNIGGTEARAVLDVTDGRRYLQNDGGVSIDATGAAVGAAGLRVEWSPTSQPKAVLGDAQSAAAVWNGAATQPRIAALDANDPNQFRLSVQSWSVGASGDLTIALNDGSSYSRGKVLLQSLSDPDSLTADGQGLYSGAQLAGPIGLQTWDLGRQLTVAEVEAHSPGSQGQGFIEGGALEGSNTDLTFEFSQMITTQRAFQAGSRVITVSDEMLQEIINLKR